MDKANVLNRRNAMKGLVTVAAAVAPVAAFAGAPSIMPLVEAYFAARANVKAVADQCAEAEDAFIKLFPHMTMVCTLLAPSGQAKSAFRFFRSSSREEVAELIEKSHKRQAAEYAEDFFLSHSPDALAAVTEALAASEAECLRLLDEVVARRDAAAVASGYDASKDAFEAAHVRLEAAVQDVFRAKPANVSEIAALGAVLADLYKEQDNELDPHQIVALIEGMQGATLSNRVEV